MVWSATLLRRIGLGVKSLPGGQIDVWRRREHQLRRKSWGRRPVTGEIFLPQTEICWTDARFPLWGLKILIFLGLRTIVSCDRIVAVRQEVQRVQAARLDRLCVLRMVSSDAVPSVGGTPKPARGTLRASVEFYTLHTDRMTVGRHAI